MGKPLRKVYALALALAAAGCGQGTSSSAPLGTSTPATTGPSSGGSSGTPSTPASPAAPASPSAPVLPSQQGDLVEYLSKAPIAAANSGAFQTPSADARSAFNAAFTSLLATPDAVDAGVVQSFTDLGYRLSYFDDVGGARWLLIEEVTGTGGTFAINLEPQSDAWFEAPHGDSDVGTEREAVLLGVELGGRAILITGADRCASQQATSCSGKSAVCGGELRISDAAHFDQTFYDTVHRALRTKYPETLAVAVHGEGAQNAVTAVVSDGTEQVESSALATKVRDAILAAFPQGTSYSCNDAADHGKYPPLCGTTDVQGRFDNGSANACSSSAATSTGHFLHLEQSPALRQASTGERGAANPVRDALAAQLPVLTTSSASTSAARP